MSKSNLALKILEHPDKDEIIAKLISGLEPKDINEWLVAKYPEEGSRFVLTEKSLISFQKDYLDFYTKVQNDLQQTKLQKTSPELALSTEIQGNKEYQLKLKEALESEIDLKTMAKTALVAIQFRIEQMFLMMQEDPSNYKMDRVVEWFNLLQTSMEKFDLIVNGTPDQINIQNNISINMVDDRINIIYNLIREILSQIDYETSILFMDRFNEEMKKIQINEPISISPEKRLAEVENISQIVVEKGDSQ